jgi:outer membrane protein assembly factor BamD
MKKALTFILVCIILISAFACRGKKTEITPAMASSDEMLFKEGEKYMKKDPEKARLYFRQVIDSFPKSFYAQRAKLAVADIYYEARDEGSLILAAGEYREFISLFPYSPSAPYAQFRIGMCFFEKALKPGRDQEKTIQALAEFKKVLTMFPLSEEAKQASEKIKDCEERLAEHNFVIGLHYYRVEAFKASTTRLTEILTNYPNYTGLDKVYYYLGVSYLEWRKADQSIPYFTKLITDYPKSKYAEKAQERMKEAQAAQAAQAKVKK